MKINKWIKEKNKQKAKYRRLKKKIENNSTSEGAYYQSEWVKINSSWVIFSI